MILTYHLRQPAYHEQHRQRGHQSAEGDLLSSRGVVVRVRRVVALPAAALRHAAHHGGSPCGAPSTTGAEPRRSDRV